MKDTFSKRRKLDIENGECPPWVATAGYQLLQAKYLSKGETVKQRFSTIAATLSAYAPPKYRQEANNKFFDLLWNGWLSAATPVLCNCGTDNGLVVSCSGSYIGDSIDAFYTANHEAAMMTKTGFGTSAYLGDIRPRGSSISKGGAASGILPVFQQFSSTMRSVSQGSNRRGSWAGYMPIAHDDFDEVVDYVYNNPDGNNLGICIDDEFIQSLDAGDEESVRRYQKLIKLRMVVGRGYIFKPDEAMRQAPHAVHKNNLKIVASNLCSEIALPSDSDHTFTCVLSSMNLSTYDEWKDTDAVFWSTVFLDCVCSDFIAKGADVAGIDKALRSAEKSRALGLGAMGLHTLFQKRGLPFDSLEAHLLNSEVFGHIERSSVTASQWLAAKLGEPLWCEGTGMRNMVLRAIAPNKSTAVIQSGCSEGISPDVAFAWTQLTAAGEIQRVNPLIVAIMKEHGVFTTKHVNDIIADGGSVQGVDWLTAGQKAVFKTAFELDQSVIVRMAIVRQQSIDQAQSLNLFFSAGDPPEYVSEVHRQAIKSRLLSLYYCTIHTGIVGASGSSAECIACEG